MSWELMFFLPRVFDAGASLVLGNPHHPKTFQILYKLI